MSNTHNYGRYYWCVKVDRNISPDGEVYLFADEVSIMPDGSIAFVREKDDVCTTNLIIRSGLWKAVYSASVIDGSAVAVEHWETEISEDWSPYSDTTKIIKPKNRGGKSEREKMTQSLRLQVMERDGFHCVLCGRGNGDNVKLEIDHIVPISKGGKTELRNLQTLCFDCNRGKGKKKQEQG